MAKATRTRELSDSSLWRQKGEQEEQITAKGSSGAGLETRGWCVGAVLKSGKKQRLFMWGEAGWLAHSALRQCWGAQTSTDRDSPTMIRPNSKGLGA